MPIYLQLYQGKIGPKENHDKWFARPVRQGEVTLKDLAQHIQNNTTFKQGEVLGLLVELVEEMKLALQTGKTVSIDGLGRFHLKVESTPSACREEFDVRRNVKAVKCQFVPTTRRNPDYTRTQVITDGVEVHLWKG